MSQMILKRSSYTLRLAQGDCKSDLGGKLCFPPRSPPRHADLSLSRACREVEAYIKTYYYNSEKDTVIIEILSEYY